LPAEYLREPYGRRARRRAGTVAVVVDALLLTHPSSLEHETASGPGGHPEQPARIAVIEQALAAAGGCGYVREASPPAPVEALSAVHPGRYVAAIRELAEGGGGRIDADTVVSEASYTAARHAAGGALELTRRLLAGEAACGFSIHRPPGHHAEPGRAMGFCLFNSVAVAARGALAEPGIERVMIVDYDVHHGNGTNAAFHADPRVLFVSVHQSPLYPGTGPLADVGSGDGVGRCVNLPVPPGAGDAEFTGLVDRVAVPLAQAFRPQLLLISAGFDAGASDPLADCRVSSGGFAAMTAALRRAGDEVGAPVGAVLEGGYSLDDLGAHVTAAMRALARPGDVAPLDSGSPPEVDVARAFLSRFWPVLAG
jgi:acetoin utilization deacetylase AcuC-like enzyme